MKPPLSGEQSNSNLFDKVENLVSEVEEKINLFLFLQKGDLQKERMAFNKVKAYLKEIEEKMDLEESLDVEEGFDWWETDDYIFEREKGDFEEESEWEFFSD
ncbi:hypothetical protein IOK37_26465 [Escherichia coli]|nr:hypothetical protein [Escherichia coli]